VSYVQELLLPLLLELLFLSPASACRFSALSQAVAAGHLWLATASGLPALQTPDFSVASHCSLQ